MELHKDELTAAGLQLIVIGLGKPEHAARYCGQLAPSQTCFVDTTNDAYHAWGLRRGSVREGLANSLTILRASAQAAAAGHLPGMATGDVQMMPGTFIVDTAGVVRYAYYSRFPGDDPEIAELVAAGNALRSRVPR